MPSAMSLLQNELRLDSRIGAHIPNYTNRAEIAAGIVMQCQALARQYISARKRPTEPTSVYNCHGLTFASRRTGINNSAVVRRLLTEDAYQRVGDADVFPGDIVVYVEKGDISHSGLVVEIRDLGGLKTPWIISKWGDAPEFVHAVRDCPYPADGIEFYRVVK